MASEWELGMAMGSLSFGMGIGASVAPSFTAAAGAPNYAVRANSPAYLYGLPSADTLRIDDLLDFSNHDLFSSSAAAIADSHGIVCKPEACSVPGCRPFAGESGSSSNYHSHSRSFADDIYIPTEEAAELEWLSKFVEDSDVPYHSNYPPANPQAGRLDPTSAVPGRGARSKRSRVVPNHLAPNQSSSSSSTSSSSSSDFPQAAHVVSRKKGAAVGEGSEGVRRCTHCASEKTPQWRTGPLGPKTLCNACGVRYKSGRLVPEYRPAASPTFMLTQHSNSHRKVMELRRQKEQLQFIGRHDNHNNHNAAAAAASPIAAVAVKAEIIYNN